MTNAETPMEGDGELARSRILVVEDEEAIAKGWSSTYAEKGMRWSMQRTATKPWAWPRTWISI